MIENNNLKKRVIELEEQINKLYKNMGNFFEKNSKERDKSLEGNDNLLNKTDRKNYCDSEICKNEKILLAQKNEKLNTIIFEKELKILRSEKTIEKEITFELKIDEVLSEIKKLSNQHIEFRK